MRVPRKKRPEPVIPQASLSDISFLLLVFFISTTKFDTKRGLGIKLPPASQNADKKVKLKDDNVSKVMVSADGKIMADKEIVPLSKIKGMYKKKVLENPDLVISLKTDRKAKYKYMIQVLDELRLSGAEKISLSTN